MLKILGWLAALAFVAAIVATAASAQTPEDAVRALGADFEAAAEVAGSNPSAGAAQVGAALDRWFDLRSMALSALPEAFRDKADDAYLQAYRSNLARAFVRRTLRAGDGDLIPIGTRQLGSLTLVGTEVREDGRLVRMTEFYMRPVGGGFRVSNVAVEGVLVTAQQQKDFRPILISGDMPALVAYLSGAP
ncbi:ABC transporter substrate-binding protein [Maritimibacter sp. UBA3975]|uniref:ABC transporter substrate-binding protein n=1 Tax=Maritimibacter sp. UBA3975 TaxID=1946833 RepID=UPI000C0A1E1A|nr:ABC transporter substrate-binding protein [Maritimibacter sp. UBA3975]MAM63120.1 hypothetical protein [Maritimibacter sp.]|tara:strand:+ start:20549 stop:21118 length:570 start_codon:yes stop_codon:yes gene_type:complete